MHIRRVQIEEGFLDGLDLQLVPGLNVVIGARGTGKTSLIELIRFGLGVQGFTEEHARRSFEHARAVLASGQVTVTLIDEASDEIIVSRTASEKAPRASRGFSAPLMFSQTEIENLGLVPASRLRLLDGFSPETPKLVTGEAQLISQIRSSTAEIASERVEIEQLGRELAQLPEIDREIAQLAPLKSSAIERILESLHILGIQLLTLTHNAENFLAADLALALTR